MAEHDWWTAPAEGPDGSLIMVTGRADIDKFRSNPRFVYRIEVTWRYDKSDSGMPDTQTSELMEQVTERLSDTFDRDPVAVLTGIYTGDGERNWVFYSLSPNIFGRKLNESLAEMPLLPITIYVENDPGWAEYDEMSECRVRASD